MKRIYSTCKAYTKTGEEHQLIGNNVQRFFDGNANEVSCVGGTWIDGLVPDLKYEEGVILVEIQIEEHPFEGYTHEAWVYGAERHARISIREPYWSRKKRSDGERNFFACGDWWLNSWCDTEFFPERKGEILKVYLRADRTDAKDESDYGHKYDKDISIK